MKNKLVILILLIVSTISTFGQSKFFIGFRDELGVINYKIGNTEETKFMIYPIQNIYFTVNFNLNDKNCFQFRPGYIIAKNEYNGWEIGANWIYNFTQINLYSSLGYNLHFNNDANGGNSGGTGKNISLIALGVGYKITKIMDLEISYQNPLKKNYGEFFYQENHSNHYINYIIKIGVAFRITRT